MAAPRSDITHGRWIIAAVAFLIVSGLAAWCVVTRGLDPADAFSVGDGALTELYTLHASHGIWGLGVYSRFGWHHPGPLLFYLLAPFYTAAGQHALGLAAGALAIALLSYLAIAAGLFRHALTSTAVVLCTGVAIYLYRLADLLTSVWNPHVLLLPYAALIILSGVTASGAVGWLPGVALLASFVAQTHVGLAPAAVALLLCAAIAGWRNAVPGDRTRRMFAWSAATLVIVWMPTIYQELTKSPGNLTQVLNFFLRGTGDLPVTGREAIAVWVGTRIAPLETKFALAYGGLPPPMPDSIGLLLFAIAEVLLLFVAARLAVRRGWLTEAWLCRTAALASIVALVAIARIKGGLADHITFWNTVSGMLDANLLVAMAIALATQRYSAPNLDAPVSSNARPASALALMLPLVVLALIAWIGVGKLDAARASMIGRESDAPVARLYRETRHAIARAGFSRPTIDLQDEWSNAAGVILQLHKHHVPFGIAAEDAWMFGAPLKVRGGEQGTVIFANVDHSRRLLAEPGDCLVAWTRARDTFVHFRAANGAALPNLTCHGIEGPER